MMLAQFEQLIEEFLTRGATDLYLTVGSPPSLRFGGQIKPYGERKLTEEDIQEVLHAVISPRIIEEFESTLEYSTVIVWKGKARFRVNLFRQQQHTGIVMRRVQMEIPSLESLHLPPIFAELIMEKRGLILVVGTTGSGKSTSLAAMLDYRNTYGTGHIVTLEDPVEFIIEPKHCIVTQRDVGIDTHSFDIGLKNALRQTPDIIVIGEIRDRETMEHAINLAETGHLCLATLHANNANQAIERVINFFPEEKHRQVLLNLSLNLKAILSQRLLPNMRGGRSLAIEILLNQGVIRALIQEGQVKEIKEHMEKGRDVGMQSFNQSLIDLVIQGTIAEEVALAESDNPANLRLAIKQHELSHRTGHMRGMDLARDAADKKQF